MIYKLKLLVVKQPADSAIGNVSCKFMIQAQSIHAIRWVTNWEFLDKVILFRMMKQSYLHYYPAKISVLANKLKSTRKFIYGQRLKPNFKITGIFNYFKENKSWKKKLKFFQISGLILDKSIAVLIITNTLKNNPQSKSRISFSF